MTPFRETVHTDHFTLHAAYPPMYAILFERIRTAGLPVLEIGNAAGGGLAMYRDYFTQSVILGIDNNPVSPELEMTRIVHHERDAYTPSCAESMKQFGPFGLIVDDGMHTWQTQTWMLPVYTRLLAPDGMLVIEDIQDYSTIDRLFPLVPEGRWGMAIDLRGVNGVRDDLLFVVQ